MTSTALFRSFLDIFEFPNAFRIIFLSLPLLKLKTYLDAEARVIKHIPGTGKYKNMLGSILVETADKKRFRIGTGFSDEERKHPPAIGSLITYKYFGLTSNGIPRFASFVRVRDDY